MDWILDNRVLLINIAYLVSAVCFIVGAVLFVPAAYLPGGVLGVIAVLIAGAAILGKLFFYDHKRIVPGALPSA